MTQEEKRILEIKLEGEEVETFKAVIKKFAEIISLPGFTQFRMDEKEKDLINLLNK